MQFKQQPFTAAAGAQPNGASARHSMLTSSAALLAKPNEQLQKLLTEYRAKFRPTDAHEDFLVSEIAVADWRTKHIARIEQGVMSYMMASTHSTIVAQDQADGLTCEDPSLAEAGDDMHTMMMGCAWVNNPKAFALLHRYATQARRDYYKALKQLELVRTGKAGYLPKQDDAPKQEENETNPPAETAKAAAATAAAAASETKPNGSVRPPETGPFSANDPGLRVPSEPAKHR